VFRSDHSKSIARKVFSLLFQSCWMNFGSPALILVLRETNAAPERVECAFRYVNISEMVRNGRVLVSYGVILRKLSRRGNVSPKLIMTSIVRSWVGIDSGTHRVFIILMKDWRWDSFVTIWAFEVHMSVTTMTGQEQPRNKSKVSKRCPHVFSYLQRSSSSPRAVVVGRAP